MKVYVCVGFEKDQRIDRIGQQFFLAKPLFYRCIISSRAVMIAVGVGGTFVGSYLKV